MDGQRSCPNRNHARRASRPTNWQRINRWPIEVLAGAAINADAASAIARAQALLGTSRRIDAEHAEQLVLAMRQRAEQT